MFERSVFWGTVSPGALACGVLIAAVVAAPKVAVANLPPFEILAGLLLGSALVLLSAIDIRTYRLPNPLTLSLAVTGLAVTWLLSPDDIVWHCVASAIGYGMLAAVAALYRYRTKRHGLGLGDAKLFAASGAWLGPSGLPSVLFLASASALAGVGLALLAGRDVSRATRVPFGPFLALGLWVVWLYGPLL